MQNDVSVADDSKKFHPVTFSIFLLCVASYALTVIFGDTYLEQMIYFNSQGETSLFRMISPAFIHAGLIHLLLNLMAFCFFASRIETRQGSFILFLLVVVSAFASNIAQSMVTGSELTFGGLSGVVFATFSYTLVYNYLTKTKLYHEVDKRLITQGIASLALGYVINAILAYYNIQGGIANTAHTVGVITGAIMAYIAIKTKIGEEK